MGTGSTMSGDEVRQLRETLGMTLPEMADYLGLRHRSQVAHLESGRTKIYGAKLRMLQELSKKSEKKRKKSRDAC